MAAGPGPSTTPRPRSPATWPASCQRIRPRHPIQVHPLPEVAGTTYLRSTPEVHRDPPRPPCVGHGWQATPGQPIPRAARQPAANGLLLVMLVLVWFSPLSIVAWLLGQAVILFQRRWHWWRFTLASLAGIGVVLAVTGPEEALRRHIFVPQHFWQYVALHFGFGPPGTRITISQFLWDLVATQVWLAIPVGLLAASLSVWNAERAAGGAEWSPFVRRRQRIDQRTRDRKTARLVARPRDHKLTAPALGIALDGDLASWRQGRYVVPPAQLRGKAMAVVGAPGAGKTITLLRLAYLAGVLGRKVCFVDCKGTDPTLVPALIAAYRLGNPTARVGCWPSTAMDMWRGSPAQVQSRLLAVEQFTEPFYQRVASAGLRLALTAPDMPPVEGSDELLRRLDVDELAALWEGRPLQLKDIEAIGDHLPGARLRYADFFAALAGAFDRGRWSYEDVDLAVLTVPTLLSKARRMRPCGWCWRTTATTPPAASPAKARTPCWSWTSSRPSPRAWTRPSTWPSGSVTSASRSWSPPKPSRAWATTARPPGCWPPAPAGSWSTSAPTPSGCWPWPGWSGPWSTTGSWTTTAPGGWPRPAWGTGPASTPRPSVRPSLARPG